MVKIIKAHERKVFKDNSELRALREALIKKGVITDEEIKKCRK